MCLFEYLELEGHRLLLSWENVIPSGKFFKIFLLPVRDRERNSSQEI